MTQQGWPTWGEIEAEAKSYGRLDEAEVARHRDRMRAEQRAYRLAEIRKTQGLTQAALADQMHVSQRRVSAVERGDLDRTDLGVVASYVEALGGRVKVVAEFPDREVTLDTWTKESPPKERPHPRRRRRDAKPRTPA